MEKSIFVNQIGYVNNHQKLAFVNADLKTVDSFSLCSEDGQVLFSSKLKDVVSDKNSKQNIRIADFSSFTQEGIFYILVDGEKSYSFKIGNKIYDDFYLKILNYFKYSRCGEDIDFSYWSHPACHCSPAVIYGTTTKKNVIGGWHDAGDYGRYVVPGVKAVMDLLFAYSACKSFSEFDICKEVRFELEWLLQMQREDGAVYHKISCFNFCGFILPNEEKEEIVISPVSTAATLDFAGCLSFASVFYKEIDKEFSEKLLQAAIKAQSFLDLNNDIFYKNPPEITTGGYGDLNLDDEKYFAMCGLYCATKEKKYLSKAISLRKNNLNEMYFWGCVTSYGTEILLKYCDLSDIKIKDELENAILKTADSIISIVEKSSYRTSFEKVIWGSNGFVCDQAHILLFAYDITKKQKYYDAALSQLDYLLGCNPFGICYVSDVGTYSVKKIHHRVSGAVKKTMPGMLSGGPSEGLQDELAKKKLSGNPPLKCFIDDARSYSTNEVAIYWNSALVYLTAKLGLV